MFSEHWRLHALKRWTGEQNSEMAFRLRLDGTTGPDGENETFTNKTLIFVQPGPDVRGT